MSCPDALMLGFQSTLLNLSPAPKLISANLKLHTVLIKDLLLHSGCWTCWNWATPKYSPHPPTPMKFAATDVYNINVVHNKAPEASPVLRAADSSQPSARFALLLLLLLSKSANQHPSPSSPVPLTSLPPPRCLRQRIKYARTRPERSTRSPSSPASAASEALRVRTADETPVNSAKLTETHP